MIVLLIVQPSSTIHTSNFFLDRLPEWLMVGLTFISIAFALVTLIMSRKKDNKNERKEKPNIKISLISSKIIKQNKKYTYLFEMTLSNLSQLNNSIKKIELKVAYYDGVKRYNKFFQHNNELQNNHVIVNEQCVPFNLDGCKSAKITAVFDVESIFKNDKRIDMYTLVLTDIYGKLYHKECTVINEVII